MSDIRLFTASGAPETLIPYSISPAPQSKHKVPKPVILEDRHELHKTAVHLATT